MKKIALLAAAAALAMTGGVAVAAKPGAAAVGHGQAQKMSALAGLAYDQNDNDSGVGLVSQNFEATFDAYDSQGADDFAVPAGKKFVLSGVNVTAVYFNGAGPCDSENVTFYKDSGGLPGAVKVAYTNLVGTGNGTGSFAIPIPKTVLKAGKYWVSVQCNMAFGVGGEWGWEGRSVQNNNMAAWQNPGGGFGTPCSGYGSLLTCFGGYGPDFMFSLKGKVK